MIVCPVIFPLAIVLSVLHFTTSDYPLLTFVTGKGKIVHLSGADENIHGNKKAYDVLSGNCFTISGVDCDKACVKKEDFWDVVKDSFAKKNNEKDKKFQYVFHNNVVILYLT